MPKTELFTVTRHPGTDYNHIQLATSEPEKDSTIFAEIRSKGLYTFQRDGHYYIAETTQFDNGIFCQHTWAAIYTKVWPVLLANGYKLEKEEPNS